MKYSKRDPMAKGYFSQHSNCEQEPFVFNLTQIFGIKTCQKRLLYSCYNSATFKPNKWPKKNEPKQAERIGPRMWSRYNISFVQLCFKQPYLPHFNSELQATCGVGFLTSYDSKPYEDCPKKCIGDSPNFKSKITLLCSHGSIKNK